MSCCPDGRFDWHIESAMKKESDLSLHKDIRLYGIDNFKLDILEKLPNDKKILSKQEKFWINKLNTVYPNGYNQTIGGIGGNTYLTKTDKEMNNIRNKISIGLSINNGNKGQYIKDKNPMYGIYPHNKKLYVTNLSIKMTYPLTVKQIKKMLNITYNRDINRIVSNKEIINGYLISESVSTGGDECSHVG